MIEKITTGSFVTNSYVISNEQNECVIVDPGLDYSFAAESIKQKYKVVAILITHGHVDHIDGIRYFDCPVYISKKDEQALYDDSVSLYSMLDLKTPFQKGKLDIHLVHDLEEIPLIGYTFKVLFTPGHTKGSVCYSYSNKVLSGDTLFASSCGRTDFPTGSMVELARSLKRIVAFYPEHFDVYPGHDGKTTIKKEKENNPYIG